MQNQTIPSFEQLLNHPDPARRLEALEALIALERSGALPAPQPGGFVNNHIHTIYSFSPYSPTAAAYHARKAGLCTAGIMDHDSVGGCGEFLRAGEILGMPVTVGFELRVDMRATPFAGRTLNNPDQRSVAYVAAHGIPHQKLADCENFLAPLRARRNIRNRKMVGRLNDILAEHALSIDFDKDILPLSRHMDGGSVTERHILCGLSGRIIDAYGRGGDTVAFLRDRLGLAISTKIQGYLLQSDNPHYLYDLIGVLKGGLVGRFYVDATDECPDIHAFVRFVNGIGAISAYAYLGDVTDSVTGDKKAQKFEDGCLDELCAYMKEIGMHAITYMPSRNTMEQLLRVMALCAANGLLQISGEDINTSRQPFICTALADPAFAHLNAATWVLIGHERAASRDIEEGMFAVRALQKWPGLEERVRVFAERGREEK